MRYAVVALLMLGACAQPQPREPIPPITRIASTPIPVDQSGAVGPQIVVIQAAPAPAQPAPFICMHSGSFLLCN